MNIYPASIHPPSFNPLQNDVVVPVQPIDPIQPVQQSDTQKNNNSNDQNNDEFARKNRVNQAVDKLNKAAQKESLDVKLEYNKDADKVVIKFIDKAHNEVVQQIPPESILKMDIDIKKFVGVLFDKRA